jgi:predicted tellurium resistance membrane protein TerC
MDFIIQKLEFVLRAIQGGAGAYAAVMLALMGFHFMTKNRQKIEEAKDGVKYIVIGIIVVIGAQLIVNWVKG